ncbi:hypothetical protein NHX12_027009 [Muraenolepis orangiensis]|uniref:Uncharacterized protein n=1 Tax=Muraenolepis orangiensis TaxID=630683 RepID=A0A9Q0EEL3_9TELE|nr:hypothetical protein NHX12_027009 [Muraenolepis orangiensis]
MEEEREKWGRSSKTTGEHGSQSKAKRDKKERADFPGPSCLSMKRSWSIDFPPEFGRDQQPSKS